MPWRQCGLSTLMACQIVNVPSGARLILENQEGIMVEVSLTFSFSTSNNQAEYEACIDGYFILAWYFNATRVEILTRCWWSLQLKKNLTQKMLFCEDAWLRYGICLNYSIMSSLNIFLEVKTPRSTSFPNSLVRR